MSLGPGGRWAAAAFCGLLFCAGTAKGTGLAREDSYAGLASIKGEVRVLWNVDATTVQEIGGDAETADAIGTAFFKRLEKGGVPVKDGAFDPAKEPFVNLELWVRGSTSPADPKDPHRIFHFQMQCFAPANVLKGGRRGGRVLVWERSGYGSAEADTIRSEVTAFIALADDLGADWRAARAGAGIPLGLPKVAPSPGR
jgi:hypothetical protein